MSHKPSSSRHITDVRCWALCLIIWALAGCTQTSAPPEPSPPAQPLESASVVPPEATVPALSPIAVASPGATPNSESVTLTLGYPSDPQKETLVKQLMERYTSAHKEVRIVPQPFPAESYLPQLLDGDKARSFDLLITGDAEAPTLIEAGALLDIQPLLTQIAQPGPDNFYGVALKPWEHGWSRYGMPISVTPQVLFYNKALFDTKGEPYPTSEWTWQDWFACARRLTQPGDGQTQIYGLSTGGWTTAIWGNGGDILNGDNTFTLIDRPEAGEGVQQFADLIKLGIAPPPPAVGGPKPVDLFIAQKVAMLPEFSSLAATLPPDLPFAWGVAPLPAGRTRAVQARVSGLSIGVDSRAQQAAFDFIVWAVGAEGQALRAQLQPHVASALKLASGQAGATPELQLIQDASGYGHTLPLTARWPEINELVNAALKPVWKGQKTAAIAYQEVAPKINAVLASHMGELAGVAPGAQASAPVAEVTVTLQSVATALPTASPLPSPSASPPKATGQPTPAQRLRFVKLNENDDPSCISVGISGANTRGWTFRVDGMNLSGSFDSGGNARLCGLTPRQEVTLTVRNSNGQTVRGGGGVPSIGGAIMSAEWR
jgi:ABC-type glycerol-3-phosphate transport system substrate-binding protein